MPYLRMFLGEQKMDEVFISEVYLESVLGNHFVEEEKQKMMEKHAITIKNVNMPLSFEIYPPSTIVEVQ